jgi:hypothetical protein
MKAILAASFVFLTGCATTQEVIKTVTVEVPVRVPCKVEVPAPKQYAFGLATKEMPIDDKVRLLLVERIERAMTEKELRAALEGCMK